MALPIQKIREIVFLILYSSQYTEENIESTESLIMQQLEITRKAFRETLPFVKKIVEKIPELDKELSEACVGYSFERIPSVEKTVLRWGLYELQTNTETPPKVILSEAIRMTRKFSTPQAGQFVNAVLDHLYKKQHGEPTSEKEIIESVELLLSESDAPTDEEQPI